MRSIEAPQARELFLEPLETAVEMVDAVDHGLAFGGKAGDHQRHRGAQVGRHHRRAAQPGDAFDGGGFAVETYPRAEPRQFLHMHEAVFEDRLGDMRGAPGAGHQRHQLRLQIGGKARERRGRHRHRPDAGAIAGDADALVVDGDDGAGLGQHVERRLQQFRARAGQLHIAAGHRHRHRIGAGLDSIRQHGVPRAVKFC